MAALTTYSVVDAGTAPTFVQATASDTAEIGSGHNTFLVYRNASGGSLSVVVVDPNETEYGVDEPGNTVSVADDGEVWIPLRKSYDPADGTGRATVTAAGTLTGLTVAAVRTG